MTERPIIFSGPMVRAVMREADPKTQTRRPVKGMALTWLEQFLPIFVADPANHLSPYGHAGEQLWVRETFARATSVMSWGPFIYRADPEPSGWREKWRPSIHMPREACRLTLDVVAVRIERLQDITEADAVAEGHEPLGHASDPVTWYSRLWDSLNAKRGYGWDTNPWVWVIEFRRANG